MSVHTFRDKSKILLSREFIRRHLPVGKLGFSMEDIDVSHRTFSLSDDVGKVRMIETKVGTDDIGNSKDRHFAIYDTVMRNGDPVGVLYGGYFVISSWTDDWESCSSFRINRREVTKGELIRWLWWDELDYWLNPKKHDATNQDVMRAVELARQASLHQMPEIPPYRFRGWVVAKINAKLKGAKDGH